MFLYLILSPLSSRHSVEAILARVEQSELCTLYGISEFKAGDAQDFLLRVALHKGRLGRVSSFFLSHVVFDHIQPS